VFAKITSKNQLTLPKAAVSQLPQAEYFDVTVEAGRIILTPLRMQKADAVREKLAEMGITEADVADAVRWARQPAKSKTKRTV
jgi:cysteinyl-tRNA synthetase